VPSLTEARLDEAVEELELRPAPDPIATARAIPLAHTVVAFGRAVVILHADKLDTISRTRYFHLSILPIPVNPLITTPTVQAAKWGIALSSNSRFVIIAREEFSTAQFATSSIHP